MVIRPDKWKRTCPRLPAGEGDLHAVLAQGERLIGAEC